jgi:hypothetical protein
MSDAALYGDRGLDARLPRGARRAGGPLALIAGALGAAALAGLVAIPRAEAAELRRIKIGVPDLEVFYFQGGVANGDTLRLQAELARLPPNKRVAILMNSGGGDYQEGLALGRLFYRAKISTFVLGNGGVCMSACAMAFLGGRDSATGEPLRAIVQGGSLGFHQFMAVFPPERKYTKADLERSVGEVQRMVFDDLKYLKEIKQDPRTYRRQISEPSESMLVIRDSAALENGFHAINAEARTLMAPDPILDRVR